jgi:FAD/FMN-containing dehydrogenase
VNLEDVQRCVEYARKHTVPLAIRGGGHSYAG